jgi:hypothetical protein
VYTLYNEQQLSLFSSSEDPGSNSATNSYGIPCHHSLITMAIASTNIACGQTPKKTPPKIPLLLHDVITGTDRKENTSSFHCCVA